MVRTGKVPFEELCDDDKIAAFFKWLMGEWSQEMEEMPETERLTAKGKAAVLTYKQCARYLTRFSSSARIKYGPSDVDSLPLIRLYPSDLDLIGICKGLKGSKMVVMVIISEAVPPHLTPTPLLSIFHFEQQLLCLSFFFQMYISSW